MSRRSLKRAPRLDRSGTITATTAGAAAIQARYDAAGSGRRLRGWVAPASGPNRAIRGAAVLRNRARDAGRNEWAGASGTRVWTTNLVGTGILARPKTKDAALKARLTDLWNDWIGLCDADGVLDFYGLQTLATRSWIESGEVFVRFRQRRIEDGLVVPLQIQVLESDMLPMLDSDLPGGNRIRSGIEFDRIGRRVAYWMHRAHPGDGQSSAVSLTDLSRVPAEQVRHIYEPRRPGQLRGITEFAPILAKLRGVMDFDDAVLERQRLANLFTLFITRPGAGTPGIDPLTGNPVTLGADGVPLAALEPGISQELLPGEGVTFSDPPDAGANYADFMRAQHLGVAAGQGTPYELLTGDLRDISDRTLRVVINEFRRHCEQRQWQIVIPMFCQPVRDAWALAAVVGGALTTAEMAEARRVTWSPQGWAYIHPVQDVQAKVTEIDAGIKARAQVIGERGDDPEEVDAERAADAKREKALGLVAPPPPAPPAPPDPNAQLARSAPAVSAMASSVAAAVVAAMPPREAAPPQISVKVDNNLPPPQVEVAVANHVTTDPTPVSVTNIVEPAPVATTVHVDSPSVSVTNQVPPSEVTVHLPARKTETTVSRNDKGEIVGTTQVESDLTGED